ncbi:MAG: ATP-binding protein [Paludibacteraceae bacterium]|nr:ATP-binding protein [Paludibacteraceae bacterium]
MDILRNDYVEQLYAMSWNGKVKIITGIRRCGKSYLLSHLYKQFLINNGIEEDCFVEIDLEEDTNVAYRNPVVLKEYVMAQCKDKQRKYYVFIDEIQRSYKVKNTDIDESLVPEEDREQLYTTFYDILNGLRKQPNIDVYVTGSNSKMLSTDVVTYFRDRGSELRVYPLSYAEYYAFMGLDKKDALEQYLAFGGMPLAVLEPDNKKKRKYLVNLHKNVYIKDIVERYKLKDDVAIDALTDAVYSAIGSLSNPHKLVNTIKTVMSVDTTDPTIKAYLGYLADAYLISEAERYDVKGKRYFENIKKYYAMDLGLRNARLNFRQQERSHLMENMIYNELIHRGYNVDVGVVEVEKMVNGKRRQTQYEIDFVVNTGTEQIYIQSSLNVDTKEKMEQETFSLRNTRDSFRKIVILDGNELPWMNDEGISFVGVIPFLLNPLSALLSF